MSYIGRSPQIGAYSKLDAITTDGSASYTMQLNSGNFVPESVNHLIVSVNGVIQAPTDSFTVSGSTITFASSLSVSDTIDFIMALGNVLDIGTPSDATVSLSKLTATGTKDATTFLRGDNTFAVPSGGTNTPAFLVNLSGDQSLASGAFTKITFNSEVYDTDSAFASNKFTVPSDKAGKYVLTAGIYLDNIDDTEYLELFFFKNGSSANFGRQVVYAPNVNRHGAFTSTITLSLNVSDYIEIYVYHDEGSAQSARSAYTFLAGHKLIGV